MTYKVFGTDGTEVGLTWDSGVYAADDPHHGTVQEHVTLPVADKTITAHKGDALSMLASVDFGKAGKLDRVEIWVDGVLSKTEQANNAGTFADAFLVPLEAVTPLDTPRADAGGPGGQRQDK